MEDDILDRTNDIKTAMKTALYFKGDVARRLRSQGILRNAIILIETLEAELETAKKERDAAIADMTRMANALREHDETQEAPCFACMFSAENTDAIGECPGYETDHCFQWAGLR